MNPIFLKGKSNKKEDKSSKPENPPSFEYKTFFLGGGSANWSSSNYEAFANEGYIKNVIAHRCINLISTAAASVPIKLYKKMENGNRTQISDHAALSLLSKPNKMETKMDFFEKLYSYKLISGNCYIMAIFASGDHSPPSSLNIIRPDKVSVLTDKYDEVCGYKIQNGKEGKSFYINSITETCPILHIKSFHPLNEYYGLSSIECARYAIDQHNEASTYAKALLQNSARPSGALIVKATNYNNGGTLTETQFQHLREQLYDQYTGINNTGKPLLLEGGLDWKEMSISPKDMDFIENKNSAAREIALAFGVPPQLLGLPGDNTYSNMIEARISLWEETIVPIIIDAVSAISIWLSSIFEEDFDLEFDKESVSALSQKRELEWDKILKADFLSTEEKREMLGIKNKKEE
jgi:HK97 family phage portal protein